MLKLFKKGTYLDYDESTCTGKLYDNEDSLILEYKFEANKRNENFLVVDGVFYCENAIRESVMCKEHKIDLIFEIEKLDAEHLEMTDDEDYDDPEYGRQF